MPDCAGMDPTSPRTFDWTLMEDGTADDYLESIATKFTDDG